MKLMRKLRDQGKCENSMLVEVEKDEQKLQFMIDEFEVRKKNSLKIIFDKLLRLTTIPVRDMEV